MNESIVTVLKCRPFFKNMVVASSNVCTKRLQVHGVVTVAFPRIIDCFSKFHRLGETITCVYLSCHECITKFLNCFLAFI